MTIEMSEKRLDALKEFFGTIGIEGENGKEIVVRIVFSNSNGAEHLYYRLFDMS